ncbi:hypothetical protein WG907_07970 [Sphingobium sp. AN558]|uniref:hypothetical protein n=1 Tax=Sphingobium sp. AN558 TaxID=3133442 RepID=UPI0030BFFE3B
MGAISDDEQAWPTGAATHPMARLVPVSALAAALILWLGVTQLLLWRFLDIMPPWAYALAIFPIACLCLSIARSKPERTDAPTIATLLFCLTIALVLLMLGGEGRFFYANIDWQVRLAALHDMRVNPWPFVYTARAQPDVLRFPIAMFLMPALAGKAWGAQAGDIAMLCQNALLLGTLMAMASVLFPTRRARMIALIVVIWFSGLDALGRMLFRGGLSDHLENWAYLQYSSMVTLTFWVPQHALSGWIGAVGYLLWRERHVRLGGFLTLLPLTALLSPLGLIGAMPFAALAGARSLKARDIRVGDILQPTFALLLSLPGLLYLAAAPEGVGIRLKALVPVQWAIFEALEVLVYIIPLALIVRRARTGADTLTLVTLWLLVIPFVQIGSSTDFMMRGSITALTLLAIMVADALQRPGGTRIWLAAMLLIGSLTGIAEVRRALVYPPAPDVRCSVFKAWDQSFGAFPKGSYIAPLAQMPPLVRPTNPVRVSAAEPARCWDGAWHHPDSPDPPGSGR